MKTSHLVISFLILVLLTAVSRADLAESKPDAVSVVVNHLRMRLQQSEEYRRWDERYLNWWTVWDVRTERGEYEPLF